MALSFIIVDDDEVSRFMLQSIIEDCGFGEVAGTAEGGIEATRMILDAKPDVVLIDLLMPDQDGIETITELKGRGFNGKFIMISQIENKEMVGLAYQKGIEFFIHKPINCVEVEHVLFNVKERWKYENYFLEMKQSLAKLDDGQFMPSRKARTVRDCVNSILMDLGIIGEIGSKDILLLMEFLLERRPSGNFPQLKELYEAVAQAYKQTRQEIEKESKTIEQRIRRTILAALTNMASIGLTDYANPKFEHYAPLYFDFQDVRLKMNRMDNQTDSEKGKVNVKKFLQVFYMETLEKMDN